jgi:HSP20 family protein
MFRSPLLSDLISLRNDVERMASQAMAGSESTPQSVRRSGTEQTWSSLMPINVYSNGEQAVIVAALPGLRPDDVEISVQQNTVTISGSTPQPADSDDARHATWYVSEIATGLFRRSITLPFAVDPDRAEAVSEHGLLRITLPKAASARAHKIAVGSGSDRQEVLAATNPAA